MKKKSLEKFQFDYQISKYILCGKRSTSHVDSLQSDIRTSFTNFVSNILKFIVNDYGLETSKLSTAQYGYDLLLNLVDYSLFVLNNDDSTTDWAKNSGTLKDGFPKFYILFELNFIYMVSVFISCRRKTSDFDIKNKKNKSCPAEKSLSIKPELCKKLVFSMSQRIQKCIAVNSIFIDHQILFIHELFY